MKGSSFAATLLLASLLAGGADAAEVRVLTDRTESHLAPLFAAFEKATGIEVQAVFMDKGLVSRLQNRPTEADVVITKDADILQIAKEKGLLQRLESKAIRAAVPAAMRDPDGMFFTDSYRARAIFYSKDRVKPEELSTYEDLADPKWKGRVCIRSGYHDYNLSLFGQMLATLGPERTRKFLEGLKANLARTPIGNDRAQAKAIFEEECDLAIANTYYMGIMLSSPEQREWGLASRIFFPNQGKAGGAFILRSALGLTKAKTNLVAATKLLEFMVSPEAQRLITNLTFAYPVNRRGEVPEAVRSFGSGQPGISGGVFHINPVSVAEIARNRDAVIRMLDEVKFDQPR